MTPNYIAAYISCMLSYTFFHEDEQEDRITSGMTWIPALPVPLTVGVTLNLRLWIRNIYLFTLYIVRTFPGTSCRKIKLNN